MNPLEALVTERGGSGRRAAQAAALLAVLLHRAVEGVARVSMPELLDSTRLGRTVAWEAVKLLRDLGLVDVVESSKGAAGSSTYRLANVVVETGGIVRESSANSPPPPQPNSPDPDYSNCPRIVRESSANSPRTIGGVGGVSGVQTLQGYAAAAAARVSRESSANSPDAEASADYSGLAARVESLEASLSSMRVELDGLRAMLAQNQGALQQLLGRAGAKVSVAAAPTLETPDLKAKLDRAVAERLAQVKELAARGEATPVTFEGSWALSVRDSMRARFLAGDASELQSALRDAEARDRRPLEQAEAARKLEEFRRSEEAREVEARKGLAERLRAMRSTPELRAPRLEVS